MNHINILFIITCLLVSCKEQTTGTTKEKVSEREITLEDMINYEDGYWTNGLVQISFQDDTLNYSYHGQCVYYYPFEILDDKGIMSWDNNMDCKIDVALGRTFDLESSPMEGKPFSHFLKLNDSTLQVNYYYKEWVNAYHEKVESDVFPETLIFEAFDF